MENREQSCCFTGHRIIPKEEYAEVTRRLQWEIVRLIGEGVRYFQAGGALGFDTLAAQTVLRLKKSFPSIQLILVLPCKTQHQYWKAKDSFLYQKILKSCDRAIYISEEYTKDCMYRRNRYLVDHSQYCICYQTKSSGGTAYTVNYAKKQCLSVTNLAQQQLSFF